MTHSSTKGTGGIHLQDRDTAILRGLPESRVMTAAHIATLFFASKPEATKNRLQKLKSAGLINERRRRVYEPSVLYLTRKAFAHLRTHGFLAEYPPMSEAALEKRARVSELTLRHELEIMDVKATIADAIAVLATDA